jgi:hypothetical protein
MVDTTNLYLHFGCVTTQNLNCLFVIYRQDKAVVEIVSHLSLWISFALGIAMQLRRVKGRKKQEAEASSHPVSYARKCSAIYTSGWRVRSFVSICPLSQDLDSSALGDQYFVSMELISV